MAKININGVTREMTAEEIAETQAGMPGLPEEPGATPEERIAALETGKADRAELDEIAAAVERGLAL